MKEPLLWAQAVREIATGEPDKATYEEVLAFVRGNTNDIFFTYVTHRTAMLTVEKNAKRRSEQWEAFKKFVEQQVKLLLYVGAILFGVLLIHLFFGARH